MVNLPLCSWVICRYVRGESAAISVVNLPHASWVICRLAQWVALGLTVVGVICVAAGCGGGAGHGGGGWSLTVEIFPGNARFRAFLWEYLDSQRLW